MSDFLSQEFLGNTYQSYATFLGVFLIGFIFKGVLSRLISHIIFLIFKKSAVDVGREKFDEIVKKPLEFIILLIALISEDYTLNTLIT